MRGLTVTTHYTPWLRPLKALYKESFPRGERKPFFVIAHGVRQGVARVFVLQKAGQFAGFMVAWKVAAPPSVVLLDYFAIAPEMQGGGLGSQAVKLLAAQYPACPLLIEIERADDAAAPNLRQRQRRRAFYLRAGFVPSGFHADLFGIQMEILTLDGQVTAQEYLALYSTMMGQGRTRRYVHILPEEKTTNA